MGGVYGGFEDGLGVGGELFDLIDEGDGEVVVEGGAGGGLELGDKVCMACRCGRTIQLRCLILRMRNPIVVGRSRRAR